MHSIATTEVNKRISFPVMAMYHRWKSQCNFYTTPLSVILQTPAPHFVMRCKHDALMLLGKGDELVENFRA
jgi:hypothetical protein